MIQAESVPEIEVTGSNLETSLCQPVSNYTFLERACLEQHFCEKITPVSQLVSKWWPF